MIMTVMLMEGTCRLLQKCWRQESLILRIPLGPVDVNDVRLHAASLLKGYSAFQFDWVW